jgi:hypothetical protein
VAGRSARQAGERSVCLEVLLVLRSRNAVARLIDKAHVDTDSLLVTLVMQIRSTP